VNEEIREARHTIKIKVIHSSDICLHLAANETNALILAAIAQLHIITVISALSVPLPQPACKWVVPILPIMINIIVECQFCVLFDCTIQENAHQDVLPNRPLCDIAVWVAGVIHKTTNPAALHCIDELRHAGQGIVCTSPIWVRKWGDSAHLVHLQQHKVEMLDALYCIFSHLLHECSTLCYSLLDCSSAVVVTS
jgi:hypothetical protein